MSKKKGCKPGSIKHLGRCKELKPGQVWIDEDRSINNMYKILAINIRNKKINGAYLDDAGWYGVDKKGVQHEDKIFERMVQKKTFTFKGFQNKDMEQVA